MAKIINKSFEVTLDLQERIKKLSDKYSALDIAKRCNVDLRIAKQFSNKSF